MARPASEVAWRVGAHTPAAADKGAAKQRDDPKKRRVFVSVIVDFCVKLVKNSKMAIAELQQKMELSTKQPITSPSLTVPLARRDASLALRGGGGGLYGGSYPLGAQGTLVSKNSRQPELFSDQ